MENRDYYPRIEISVGKIYENAKTVVDYCGNRGVSISGVIKGFNGIPRIAKELKRAGCAHLASSRLEQLVRLRKHIPDFPFMLLRIPMLCELEMLVSHIDISLNSELETIMRIEQHCRKLGKKHGIILMLDLGDLREGFYDSKDLIDAAIYIEKNLKHVILLGIGTNLGCYGSVVPTAENLGELCRIAAEIESLIGRKLEMVSGGGTTSIPLLLSGKMPSGINHLRVGEEILLDRDLPDLWGVSLPGMHQDTFTLKAQVIEVKNKPTHPVGELFLDAFGNKPVYQDRGIRRRALLAVGKGDFVQHDKLIPLTKGIEIIGSSSDHLIIDIEDCRKEIKVGDILAFHMFYGPMLYLTGSRSVKKVYLKR